MFAGISLKLVSTLAFTFMAACVKLIGLAHPDDPLYYTVGQTVFFRSLFALIPVFIWLAWRRELVSSFRGSRFRDHARRGFFGGVGMFSGFTALILLPLADATALSYAAPLFTVVLAAIILKEQIRLYRWTAVGAGFVGVIVMLTPHWSGAASSASGPLSDLRHVGAFFGLLGAVCSGFATIETRKLTERHTTGSIVAYFMLLTSLLGFLTIVLGWVDPTHAWKLPSLRDGALLVAMGIMGGIGQITLTQSFRYADASIIAPFDYVSMVWAVLVGWFLFGELPATVVLMGASVVVAAGMFVIWRERQLGLDRRRQKESGPTRGI
jgi:drug/metabolite transporter (DMT)-like permease